jgi:O-antigen/teichoic acid export membrane protein
MRQIFKNSDIRNVATVLSGATLAQFVSIAVSPIISRIYSPDTFGLLGAFSALFMLVGTLAGLTYPAAIVLPSKDHSGKVLASLSILVGAFLCLVLLLITIFFHDSIAKITKLQSIHQLLYLLPFLIFFESVYQAGLQWMIRTQRYTLTAKINLIQSIVSGIFKIGGGFIAPSAYMLVGTSLLAVPFNALSIYYILNRSFVPKSWPAPMQKEEMLTLAKEYKDFPIYRAPHSLLWVIGQNFPTLFIIQFMGAYAAGLYSMSNALLGIPVQVLSRTVYDVFMVKLSRELDSKKSALRPVALATSLLALISGVPFLLIMLSGPWIFATILGPNWVQAGEYARWGAALSFTTIISRPSFCAMAVLRKQGLLFGFEIINISVRALSMLAAFYYLSGNLAPIIALSLSGAVINLGQIAVIFYICNRYDQNQISSKLQV